jgi:Holin of 3TMs, for gene-transfer release
MGGLITGLLGGGGGAVLDGVSKVIDSIKGKNPGDALALQTLAANYQAEFLAAQTDLAKAKLADNEQLNATAGQNIRADAQSQDKFTQRARPLFMYIVEAILAFNYIGIPLGKVAARMFAGAAAGAGLDPIVLPTNLLTLFGFCVCGYVGARSIDKALELPGDSSVNILGASFKNNSPN